MTDEQRIAKLEEAIRHLAHILNNQTPAESGLKRDIEEILND